MDWAKRRSERIGPDQQLDSDIGAFGRALLPTGTNGQPAFGANLRTATGIPHGIGLCVLTLAGDRIAA